MSSCNAGAKMEEKISDEEEDEEFCASDAKKRKVLTKPGIIYLSKVPPYMKPIKVRTMFSQFGELKRIYLQPEDQSVRQARKKHGGSGRKKFTEGWVEFKDKKKAKLVAKSLNNTPIGGKKRGYYCDDIWNIKYLPKFKWSHISEKLAYEKASREQRMRTEMAQARREATVYMENVAKSKQLKAMEDKRKRKGQKKGSDASVADKQVEEGLEVLKTKFRQKGVVSEGSLPKLEGIDGPVRANRERQLDPSLLLKVFGSK